VRVLAPGVSVRMVPSRLRASGEPGTTTVCSEGETAPVGDDVVDVVVVVVVVICPGGGDFGSSLASKPSGTKRIGRMIDRDISPPENTPHRAFHPRI